MNSVRLVLNAVCRGFESVGVDYLVGGSFSSGAWGQPRQTNDLDVSIRLRQDQVDSVVTQFETDFMISAEEIRRTLDERTTYRSFQMLHFEEVFKIDVFVPLPSEYTDSEFERKRKMTLLEGVTAMCAAPENIVIQKLRWFELGNRVSDRQWNDIVQVLDVQKGRLDMDYLYRWVDHFGLRELLNDALSQTFD
jgi:hypothetical protein